MRLADSSPINGFSRLKVVTNKLKRLYIELNTTQNSASCTFLIHDKHKEMIFLINPSKSFT